MRALLSALVLILASLTTTSAAEASPPDSPAVKAVAMPSLSVKRVVTNLANPWDVQQIGGGKLLITERDNARLLIADSEGTVTPVNFPSSTVWVSGETGLMSMAIDANFASNRTFYLCQGFNRKSGAHDVRVGAWRLSASLTTATRKRWLLKGIPATSGRHGGCRLLLTTKGALLIGTGDAAVETNPQSLKSLGGKVLRLDPTTGKPWPKNPWFRAANKAKRYLFTYGHRNVQGLAQRANGTIWSAEHGSDRDDEINLLGPGRNFGWDPGPGYDESVPMTDNSLPGKQFAARWSSGLPTIATSGAAWVSGSQWGRLNGTLAVATLKGERIVFMKFNKRGRLKWTKSPAAVRQFGRLRSVTSAANGDLLVTTSNGADDAVLRIKPKLNP